MPTSLRAIATKARERKDLRFFNLYRLIDEALLRECWHDIRKNAASGVDGVSAKAYEENLMDNIGNLVERLKRKTYRARLVRRHWIPKPDGRQRPLGIPVVEDKLLQLAVTRILEAIYEQDFLRCSYGYRPNTGALDAVDKLTVKLQFGDYHFVARNHPLETAGVVAQCRRPGISWPCVGRWQSNCWNIYNSTSHQMLCLHVLVFASHILVELG